MTNPCGVCGFDRPDAKPPNIELFTASSVRLFRGMELILEWRVYGSESCQIDGIGSVPPIGWVSLAAAASRNYVMTAANAFGRTEALSPWIEVAEAPTVRSLTVTFPEVNIRLGLDKSVADLARVDKAVRPISLKPIDPPSITGIQRRPRRIPLPQLPELPELPTFF